MYDPVDLPENVFMVADESCTSVHSPDPAFSSNSYLVAFGTLSQLNW